MKKRKETSFCVLCRRGKTRIFRGSFRARASSPASRSSLGPQLPPSPALAVCVLPGMSHSDEEPEFDPDLELDMPDLPSNGDSFGGASFGGGFGSSLNDDFSSRDSDQPPSSFSLPPSTSRSRHPSTTDARGVSDPGDALGLADEDAFSTPLRRSRGAGSGAPGSNRLSLAFELASAQSPAERSSNRDLLRSLGIEEEDEDPDGAEDEDDEDDEEYDEVEDSGYGGGGGADLTPRAVVVVHASDSPSPPRAPKSRMSSASIASTYRDHDHFPSPDPDDPTATAMAREESDAAFLIATSSLESSLSTTGVFLSHLRQHTTTDVDPHSHSHHPPPPRPPVSPDPFSAAPADYTDRQPLLESLASSVIKSMYDLTKQREGQVRELAEMERLVSKNEAGWQAALRNLDELPRDDDVDVLSPTNDASPPSSDAGGDVDEPVETVPTPRAPRTAPPTTGTTPAQSFPSSARIELSNLRDITTSLISALSAINEVTQVNNASVGEAGRKLRALRGHLGAAKDDLVALARSEDFVREYERKELEEGSGGKKGRFAEMAREQMRGAEEALDEGWRKAQEVLASA